MSLLRISSSAAGPNSAWYADPICAMTSCTRQPAAALCLPFGVSEVVTEPQQFQPFASQCADRISGHPCTLQ
jgi:hypothetical protein